MLRFCDGFDYYPTADLAKKWSGVINDISGSGPSVQPGLGRYGAVTGALRTSTGVNFGTSGVTKSIQPQNVVIVGFAFKFSGSTECGRILTFNTPANNSQAILTVTAGQLRWTNGTRDTIAFTGTTAITAGVWHYIEMKSTFSASCASNSNVVRLNGVPVIIVPAGTNTIGDPALTTTAGNIRFGGQEGTAKYATIFYDDLYVCDGTGSINNDFLGDCRIEAIFPSGAGTTTNFTATGATSNHQAVNETSENGDTSYVAARTPGFKDTYAMGDLDSTPAAIYGVQVSTIGRKDDAGNRLIAAIIRSGGVDYDHSGDPAKQFGLADDYTQNLDIWGTDPNGNIPWTGPAVNAIESGFKIVG